MLQRQSRVITPFTSEEEEGAVTVSALIGVLRIVVVTFGLVLYSGWGLMFWLAPARLLNRAYLVMPFVGLFLIDSLSHLASYAGASGQESIWIVGAVATLVNGAAIVWRRQTIRRPNRLELSLAACSLPALLLGVAPILWKGTLLPIGDSNADPISYSAATSFLRSSGMRSPIPISLEHPINVPVYGILRATNDRLGFEFLQVHVNILSGTTPPESFSVISAFGLFLWTLAAGFTATMLLPAALGAPLLATLLVSASAFPLWIAYGGYGSQVLGMGMLIMAFSGWVVAIDERSRRAVGLAAALSAGVAGIYSDCLPYLLIPTVAFSLGYTVFVSGPTQWRSTLIVLVNGAVVSMLANPVGWSRAVPNVLRTTMNPSAGNVDWIVDLRQVAGAVPFDRHLTSWFGAIWTDALWLPAVLMVLLAVYGFLSLSDRSALIAACFIVPHVASLGWFYYRGNPYGYFKAWSIGSFIYVVLLAVGFVTLKDRTRRPVIARLAVPLALSFITAGLAVSSVLLARSMTTRFSCAPAIAELGNWAADIDSKDTIYVSTGTLPPVSAFWIAYYLRQHPLHFDAPVLYTSFQAQPFRGEPWAIQYRRAEGREDGAFESAGVVRQNDSFRLLSSRAQR